MKRIIILSALALMAGVSCTKTISESEKVGSFSIEAGFPETKAYMGESESSVRKVLWKAGDQICVNGIVSDPLDAQYDGCSAAKFTFAQTPSTPYKMVYPAAAFSADSVVVPAVQTYVNKQFDPKAAIFVGTSSESFISLANVCGYVQVTVAKEASEEISEIQLTAHQPLCGKFAVDFATPALVGGAEQANVVTVTTPDGVEYDASGKACAVFVIPAGNYPAGFSAVIKTKDGKKMVKNAYATTGVTVQAGKIFVMPELAFAEGGSFSGGLGTEANPFKIASVQDLKEMATYINSATGNFATAVYSQIADIENAAVADHIGTATNAFKGIYHGNGHKITNISFSAVTAENCQGLFGTVMEGALIDYLTIEGFANENTNKYSGVFVGVLNTATIDHCVLSGPAVVINGGSQVGGIVGRNSNNGVITNCRVEADLTFSGNGSGGITGLLASGSSVKGCVVTSKIMGAAGIGGIAGYCESTVGIDSCIFSGAVVATGENCGGILGYKNNRSATVSNCVSCGTVSSSSNYAGGIVGCVNSSNAIGLKIVNCTNSSKVDIAGAGAGGIIGYVPLNKTGATVTIDNCVNTGDITATYSVSGIAGHVKAVVSNPVTIINCLAHSCTLKATSAKSKYARIGGILGCQDTGSKIAVNILNCGDYDVKMVADLTGDSVNGIGGVCGSFSATGSIKGCYSSLLNTDITYVADTILYKGGIVGYNKATLDATDYYDSANKYGAFYATNPCIGITTAQFTDGTLLSYMNAAAATIEGAASWVADKSGYPVPQR